MSDATERPAGAAEEPDPNAWAAACEEDLAAERERRTQHGTAQPNAAEELRRLADAVADRLAQLRLPFASAATQGAVQSVARQLVDQAKEAARPVVERHPEVFDHLAAAGQELLAAYHAAVREQEGRWTRSGPASGGDGAVDARADRAADPATEADTATPDADTGAADEAREDAPQPRQRPDDGEGGTGTQRIDLD